MKMLQSLAMTSCLAGLLGAQGPEAAAPARADISARQQLEFELRRAEQQFGSASVQVGDVLGRLGAELLAERDPAAACEPFARKLAIDRAATDPTAAHRVIGDLVDLGHALAESGQGGVARLFFTEAVTQGKPLFENQPLAVVQIVVEFGAVLVDLGDYAGARDACMSARAICDRIGRPVDYSADLAVLAEALAGLGQYEEALGLTQTVLAIDRKAQPLNARGLAASLCNLGNNLVAVGRFAEARALFEEAIALVKPIGEQHPDMARILELYGGVLEALNDFKGAVAAREKALDIDKRQYGQVHEKCALDAMALARSRLDLGDVTGALKAVETWRTSRDVADMARKIAMLPERDALSFAHGLVYQTETSLAVGCVAGTPEGLAAAYDDVLATKTQVLRACGGARQNLLPHPTEAQRAAIDRLRELKSQSSRVASGVDEGSLVERAEKLAKLTSQVQLQEQILCVQANARAALLPPTWRALRSALAPRSALIDVFGHRRHVPASKAEHLADGPWAERRLSAWITRPDEALPRYVDLGPEADLQARVAAYLNAIAPVRGDANLHDDVIEHAAGELRTVLWSKLAPWLKDVDLVFISPDGPLCTLPFGVIQDAGGRFLVESHAFVQLSDVGRLMAPPVAAPSLDGALLAVGGVDYMDRDDGQSGKPIARYSIVGCFGRIWPELPSSATEATDVLAWHAVFAPNVADLSLDTTKATEERIKQELPRHAIAHLATHGFFRPVGAISLWDSPKALPSATPPDSSPDERLEVVLGRSPGLLSGLLCSGANVVPPTQGDDGMLTAEEVAWLDLSGVDLVVLSACDTGLGRPAAGEGLLGLRRAFQMAGARTVVSSLWILPDPATSRLMRAFYERMWRPVPEGATRPSRAESLRLAQLEVLNENRTRTGDAYPRSWGAFVLDGEWR